MENNLVLFINPPGPKKLYRSIVCTFISKANYIWQPQDFINLSAQIPDSFNLDFIDCCQLEISLECVLQKIRIAQPSHIVLAISSITYLDDLKCMQQIRDKFPKVKLLILGNIVLERQFWPEVLQQADGIILNSFNTNLRDYLLLNKSASDSLVLAKNFKQAQAGAILPAKATPAKVSLGLPRHKLFLNKKYRFPFVKSAIYATVSTQFGCPFSCSYCSWSQIPVFFRDADEVLAELESVSKLKVMDIFFGDASFGTPRINAKKILLGMIERKINLRWVCYANPAAIDEEFLQLMHRAGCHTVIIGIDDENMDLVREKFKRTLTKKRLTDFCQQAHQLGIEICGDFIVGLNKDSGAVDRMVAFAKELSLDYCSFNIINPLFGSILRKDLIAEGALDPFSLDSDTSGALGEYPQHLIKLRNRAVRDFYLRPLYLIRRALHCRSIGEFRIRLEEMFKLLVRASGNSK